MTKQHENVRSIAFRTGRGLGDAVLCEPLVRAIVQSYPDAELTVVMPNCCQGIAKLGFLGHHFEPWLEADEFAKLAIEFDLAIDADPAQYEQPFETVTPSGTRLVSLFAHYRAEAERTTAYERMAEGLARIGIDALHDTPTLILSQAARDEARDIMASLHLRREAPLVVIHPGSSPNYSFKRWQPEGFAFVADEFIERYDANIVFVGSGQEDELLDDIQGTMTSGQQTSRAFGWTLCQVALLLENAALFIGNDSGVGHLAAAIGRPTVTVAGPTGAYFWGPMTDRALVTDPNGCCFNPSACGVKCLKAIRGCEVLGAAEALLSATTKREVYPCLDPIQVSNDLAITKIGSDSAVLCNRVWQMPLTIERGRDYVLNILDSVDILRSAKRVRQEFPDADILIEQCFRHAIILPSHTTKENHNIVQ